MAKKKRSPRPARAPAGRRDRAPAAASGAEGDPRTPGDPQATEPAGAEAEAPPPALTQAPPPSPAVARATTLAPPILAALTLLLAIAAAAPAATAPFPGVWDLARLALAAAAAASLARRFAPARLRPHLALAAAALTALAGAAAYGPQPLLHQSPFLGANPAFLGLPALWPFALLAASALALRRPAPPGAASERLAALAHAGLGLGLVWGGAVLLLPDVVFGAAHPPLSTALSRLAAGDVTAGLALLAGAVSVGATLLWAVRRLRRPALPAPALAGLGAAVIALHHLAAGLSAGTPLPGLMMAALALTTVAALVAAGEAVAADPPGLRIWARAGVGALIAIPLALFLLLKTHGMGTSNTDENIYFYMARDLARGRLPYVDYFFAHPPLHVLIPGAILAVFGWSFTLAKLFAITAAAVTGGAIFAIGRRLWGPVAGALAAVLFLFATEQLKASANMTGINLTTMWLTLGLWASLRARGALAGALLGLAAGTGFYSMAAICALLVLLPFRPRDPDASRRALHPGLRQLIAFGLVAGGVNLFFYALAGGAYVEGVYSFHGMKALRNAQMVDLFGGATPFPLSLLHNVGAMTSGREMQKELFYQAHLWMGLIMAPLVAIARFALASERRSAWAFLSPRRWWRESPGDGAAVLVTLVALALFVQYAMFRELYSFYFVLIYPTLALLAAYAVTRAAILVASVTRDAALLRPRAALVALAVGVALLGSFGLYRAWSAGFGYVFTSELEQVGSRNDYAFRDAPVLPGLSGVVRALFWGDHREKGDAELGYRHYLWNKKRTFSTAPAIADYVRAHSGPDETMTGGSTAAPLVALLADRRLAAGEVDTNNKRFKTGLLSEQAFWDAACKDGLRFVLAVPGSYFEQNHLASLGVIRRYFTVVQRWDDADLSYGGATPFVLWERRADVSAPDGRPCRWE